MKIKGLFFIVISFLAVAKANAESIRLSNDTLYCNLSTAEIGSLKSQTSGIPDLNKIKTLILGGYISQADENFIHTLGKDYSLENLDFTNLHSVMSYEGLQGCVKIKTVKYSKYWNTTGHYLFEDCCNLTDVVFPDDSDCSLTYFSSGTFRGCSSLKTITIPSKISSMDSQVFYLCNNLKEIHCKSGIAPSSTKDTFGDQFQTATIFVPTGAVQNYKTAAGWCLFANYKEDSELTYEADSSMISNNVSLSNDTLYCNLPNNEMGYLRTSTLAITDEINSIKHVVLGGYLNSNDGDFLNALASAYSLSSLDMTSLKTTFNNKQFQGCNKLTEIKYSKYWNSTGTYLFKDCSMLAKITFPDNVIGSGYTQFETGSFRGCSSLEEITIPSKVKSIDSQCFYSCDKLKVINLKPITPPSAKEESFDGQFSTAKLIVPKGTKKYYKTSSGWSLFKYIEESTEDITIDEKEISENISFSDSILYVNLPAEEVGRLKATVLSKYPDLSLIRSVVIGNYINEVDASFLNALASSYNLNSIDFTELKNSFGDYAFQGCAKLSSVKYSRYWNSTGWYLFKECSSLVDVLFPVNPIDRGIMTFETGSFRGCTSLENITIPKYVSSIESQCFYQCHNLKSVTFLGAFITSIDKNAFEDCYSLETITLPSSMTLIGERCFEGCTKIKEIRCESVTPPDASENTFDSIYNTATLYVPKGCRAKYAAAPIWKNFSNIEEAEVSSVETISSSNNATNRSIFNIEGKLIYQGNGNPNLPKGIYVINQNDQSKKIIVE